jgi:hypothetical protein
MQLSRFFNRNFNTTTLAYKKDARAPGRRDLSYRAGKSLFPTRRQSGDRRKAWLPAKASLGGHFPFHG